MRNLFKRNTILLVLFLFVIVPRLIVFIFQDRNFVSDNGVVINVIVVLSILVGVYLFVGGIQGFRYKVKHNRILSTIFILVGLGLVIYSLYSLLVFSLWSNYTGL
ncbi:hypothetical protein BK004_01930 [bacterium CG10_46_32]|nr:MAG: hypothetical protein BK004_01930 [bacterium CG10_46_32]PIR56195.1 MAG: hypothetical protein COU73_01960 [Parcubacteria group bacterium CG10_big_fil_rev_8_21_14_0_10_46_32]